MTDTEAARASDGSLAKYPPSGHTASRSALSRSGGRLRRLGGLGLAAFGTTMLVQLAFGRIPIVHVGFAEKPLPPGIFVHGVVVGSLYALVACGLVLVYRAHGIINFAQVAMGSVPAVLGLVLATGRGLPYLGALAVALAGAVLVGVTVEHEVVRRFRDAPRLLLSVATIGLALLLAFFEFKIPGWLVGEALSTVRLKTPFSGFAFDVGIVRFTGDAIVTVIVVAACASAVAGFLRRHPLGVAIRATADNRERAELLGVPMATVGMAVWSIAAVLSAIAVFQRATLVGLPLGGSVGPSVLLYGLAAAGIARMERFDIAAGAAVALGVVDQAAVFASRDPSAAYATVLPLLVIALAARGREPSRAEHAGASPWNQTGRQVSLPEAIAALPELRVMKAALVVLGTALALLAPYVVSEADRGLETKVVLYALVGISLVVLTGWTGQISLGQFGFVGVGAAVAGALATRWQADFVVGLVIAGLAGAAVAVVIGLPALRMPGALLSVTTLAFAFFVQAVVLNRDRAGWLLPSESEPIGRPVLYGFFPTRSDTRYYYLCLAVLLLVGGAVVGLQRARTGRLLQALRDNPRAARSYAVRPATTQLFAFALSGFVAALAGALLAHQRGAVDATGFAPIASLDLFLMAVIGGVASVGGAVLGAVYVLGVPLLPVLRDVEDISMLTSSVGVLALLLVAPSGLAGLGQQAIHAYGGWAARRRGLAHLLGADGGEEDPSG